MTLKAGPVLLWNVTPFVNDIWMFVSTTVEKHLYTSSQHGGAGRRPGLRQVIIDSLKMVLRKTEMWYSLQNNSLMF